MGCPHLQRRDDGVFSAAGLYHFLSQCLIRRFTSSNTIPVKNRIHLFTEQPAVAGAGEATKEEMATVYSPEDEMTK